MLTFAEEKLRDEFAKQALIAIAPIAWEEIDRYSSDAALMEQIAESCYLMADAMLKARKASTEGNN